MLDGILLLDKPVGITSFDAIRQLRKKLGKIKMGHAGTLDPAASGLMLIGVGSGTKELAHLIKLDKVYVAGVLLGEATDTLDRDGEVTESVDVPTNITEDTVRDVVSDMVGTHTLLVPAYSAIKINGTPLYTYAREGRLNEVEIPKKDMRIDAISLKRCEEIKTSAGRGLLCEIEMDVGSGTYVRSIAEEIGKRLSVPARLETLHRTRVGDYHIEDAKTVEEIT